MPVLEEEGGEGWEIRSGWFEGGRMLINLIWISVSLPGAPPWIILYPGWKRGSGCLSSGNQGVKYLGELISNCQTYTKKNT
jgi:hypothetical protein